MRYNDIWAQRVRLFGIALILSCVVVTTVHAAETDHTTSVRGDEKCSPCVLILFLYDLNKQWHVIRAATYNSLDACKSEGNRVNEDMMRQIDKKPQRTTNFYCLREGL